MCVSYNFFLIYISPLVFINSIQFCILHSVIKVKRISCIKLYKTFLGPIKIILVLLKTYLVLSRPIKMGSIKIKIILFLPYVVKSEHINIFLYTSVVLEIQVFFTIILRGLSKYLMYSAFYYLIKLYY